MKYMWERQADYQTSRFQKKCARGRVPRAEITEAAADVQREVRWNLAPRLEVL